MDKIQCPICQDGNADGRRDFSSGVMCVDCPRCGRYSITHEAEDDMQQIDRSMREVANAVGWLRQNQGYQVREENWKTLYKMRPPSFHERADILLQTMEKQTNYAGEFVNRATVWIAASWSMNVEEMHELLRYLESCERIVPAARDAIDEYSVSCKICPAGWARLEELKEVNPDSHQCFVAMWFDQGMQNVYDDAIAIGIGDAGYSPHRVDLREHNGKIDDEIIAQIRRSRFVLADFTGHRGGVYFEAGFAKGLGLEVIWTCREDAISDLHFDIRQYNCLS